MKNRFVTVQPEDLVTKKVIGLAMKVHRTLGPGFLETVYRNAMVVELRRENIVFVCHPTLSVTYEGIEVGSFQADLIIDDRFIIELKAVELLNAAHSAQLVNYLKATRIPYGLLLNFGAASLEFKTKSRDYPPPDLHA